MPNAQYPTPYASALRLRPNRMRPLARPFRLRELAIHVIPVDVPEERLDVLLAPVGRRPEVARVGMLVDVERQHGDHVVDRPEVLGVHYVVEDRPVVEVVADHHPAARRRRPLAHGILPAGDAAGLELVLEQLGEAALGLAAVAAEVAEVER